MKSCETPWRRCRRRILSLLIAILAGSSILAPTAGADESKTEDLFGEKFWTHEQEQTGPDRIEDRIVGLYFSAHWCPPCRMFTPKLVEFYDELKEDEAPFEIVLVSSDRSREAMFEYMEKTEMSWLALPHRGKRAQALSDRYKVRGIPTLIIIGPDGETITKDGRRDVTRHGVKAFSQWRKATEL
ncbi:thioredoxin family protein [Kiritimatiella glycovorans]|uniref:Thioredoxin n=1 Tax=Kiritimatiella glycovorans TaxID=1307763 RepID=A0A0G3ED95_9BACT|nr:thioredoxin family protein [Kiritimatiella glycovorans]AKJ64298.1 Thioredoxin [Kiritimatiella glycovorans]